MEGQLQSTVGKNLKLYRERLGISQEELAHRLNVHRTYMGGVERGERNLTLQTVERLALSISVDPIELLTELRFD